MKLKNDFISHETGDEFLLVPVGGASFSGIVRGNRTLGAIVGLLKADTTEDDIVRALAARFDGPEEKIRSDVRRAVAELRRIGALDE